MPAPNVKIIPARDTQPKVLRVAAYCRVSSDSADQLHSYAAQIRYYTNLIASKPEWELADIYADEARTGTRADKREDFQRLMSDCRNGKIDVILVKSISRFARNTRDCLSCLRELGGLGISVRFEEENIDTKTLTSELMVSVFGSLAQQESISISQNMRMSYQRRMEKGEFITCCAPYGFRLKDKKELTVCPEESEIVSWIYDQYLNGSSMEELAKRLTKEGVPSPSGLPRWDTTAVRRILNNEKCMGDTLCQKTFSEDVFPYKSSENHGQRPQYYIRNSHPAIITDADYQSVQALRVQKGPKVKIQRKRYPLTMKIYCGSCGTAFIRRQTSKGHPVWVCRKHDDKAEHCHVGRITEHAIYLAFLRMVNKLRQCQNEVLGPAIKHLEALEEALTASNPALAVINREIAETLEQSYRVAVLEEKGLIDQSLCIAKRRTLDEKIAALRRRRRLLISCDSITEKIHDIRELERTLQAVSMPLTAFDEELFSALVEQITADSSNILHFRLYGGIELTEQW